MVRNDLGNPAVYFDRDDDRLAAFFDIEVRDVTLISVMQWLSGWTPFNTANRTSSTGSIAFHTRNGRIRYWNENNGRNTVSTNGDATQQSFPGIYSIRFNDQRADTFIQRAGVDGQSIVNYQHGSPGPITTGRVNLGPGTGREDVYFEAFAVYPYLETNTYYEVTDLLNDGHWIDSGINTPLPLFLTWHEELYDWLETLEVSDVSSPKQPITYGSGATEDELYPLYGSLQSGSQYMPTNYGLRAPDEYFVLDDGNGNGFVGDGATVRVPWRTSSDHSAHLMEGTWWAKLDMPGLTNPYLNNDNIKRRFLAQGAVELIMVSDWAHSVGSSQFGDYAYMMLNDIALRVLSLSRCATGRAAASIH